LETVGNTPNLCGSGEPHPTDWVKSELLETMIASVQENQNFLQPLPIGLNRNCWKRQQLLLGRNDDRKNPTDWVKSELLETMLLFSQVFCLSMPYRLQREPIRATRCSFPTDWVKSELLETWAFAVASGIFSKAYRLGQKLKSELRKEIYDFFLNLEMKKKSNNFSLYFSSQQYQRSPWYKEKQKRSRISTELQY
jgi:hypothetical protein